ncbi:MAG TPA: hypothetical protein VGS41_06120 [Chthonomonadales bacterium]|nr:hypothetical protein [Chthonomonadales bacterium]
MLLEEALWFETQIRKMNPLSIYPMCNVGSSTLEFRTSIQPWIDKHLFQQARARGLQVDHLDMKLAPGVDIVGDVTDPGFLEAMKSRSYRSAVCSNVLEHLTDRRPLCRALMEMVVPGGYLFVSCPYRYPYHPDPIDSLFRPSARQLAQCFPGMEVCTADHIAAGTYLQGFAGRPLEGVRALARLCLPFYKPKTWRLKAQYIPWMFRSFEAACVVLRRPEALQAEGAGS